MKVFNFKKFNESTDNHGIREDSISMEDNCKECGNELVDSLQFALKYCESCIEEAVKSYYGGGE